MIRVLIVDDSAVMRQSTRFILESDPGLQVIGEACNGEEAVAKVGQLHPDVITMDINMPRMDGFEAIRKITAEHSVPIIVVTSVDLEREIGFSTQATKLGAVAVLVRPPGIASHNYRVFATKLLEQIKLQGSLRVIQHTKEAMPALPSTPVATREPAPRKIELVTIGSSTGGPAALYKLLGALPKNFPVPVLIVQHISFGFVEGLAGWLDAACPLHVKVAAQGESIQPGQVYVAPDGFHLQVNRYRKIQLSDSPTVGGFRPSITPLFESVAQVYGPNAVGVMLTGMGADGAAGMVALYKSGAITIAQNEATCVVFGMPKEAIALGVVKHILALDQIAPMLVRVCAQEWASSQNRSMNLPEEGVGS